MLIVISDLHFEEVASDKVAPDGAPHGVRFDERNLKPGAFDVVFGDLTTAARRNGARNVDIVLAGDIFDLHRTRLWFDAGGLRPYLSCTDVASGSRHEEKILQILDGIAADDAVATNLAALRRLAGVATPRHGGPLGYEWFGVPTRVHYLPGNHDRLVNATPATRLKARELLGLGPSTARFPHVFESADPRVLVRHGHEYDALNFGGRLSAHAEIPVSLSDADYDDWTFGDFVTVDVAMGLPDAFREVYQDRIAFDPLLSTVYGRLLEFDDVRPQSQLVAFLLTIPGQEPTQVWRVLEPAFVTLLERLAGDPNVDRAFAKGGVSPLWRLLLDARVWRWGLPLALVRRLGSFASRRGDADPAASAVREEVVAQGRARFVVAGHTHHPQVALLSTHSDFERYFVDTGTWRNVVLSTGSGAFANTKAITHVAIYASTEDPGGLRAKRESFDFWSGCSKRW